MERDYWVTGNESETPLLATIFSSWLSLCSKVFSSAILYAVPGYIFSLTAKVFLPTIAHGLVNNFKLFLGFSSSSEQLCMAYSIYVSPFISPLWLLSGHQTYFAVESHIPNLIGSKCSLHRFSPLLSYFPRFYIRISTDIENHEEDT